MKITKYKCDDCKKELIEKEMQTIFQRDYCKSCLSRRIVRSYKDYPHILCSNCIGKGQVKEFYYEGHNLVTCEICSGTGFII